MKPTDIIRANAQQQGVSPEAVVGGVGKAIQEKRSFIIQENDTVLVATLIGPGTIDLHMFTMDPPMTLVKSIAKALEQIKRARFIHVIYVQSKDPQIKRLMDLAGWQPQHSDKLGYDWMIRI